MVREGFRRVSKRTLDHLQSYLWPGNIRELQNVIERSVIVCDSDEFVVDEGWLSASPHVESRLGLSSTLAVHKKAIIEDALRQAQSRLGSFCTNAAFLTSVTYSAGDPQTGGFESAFSGSG